MISSRGRYRWPIKLAVNRCECWHFMFVRQSSWSVRITTSWPIGKILKLDSIWQKANAAPNVTSPFKWPGHDRCASRQLLFEFLVLVRVRVRRVRVEPLPPGGTPLYKPYKYVPSQRVGFLRPFGLKTGIDFAHFGLESGMVFEETTWVYERIYRFNSKLVRKKEKYAFLSGPFPVLNKSDTWICSRAVVVKSRPGKQRTSASNLRKTNFFVSFFFYWPLFPLFLPLALSLNLARLCDTRVFLVMLTPFLSAS